MNRGGSHWTLQRWSAHRPQLNDPWCTRLCVSNNGVFSLVIVPIQWDCPSAWKKILSTFLKYCWQLILSDFFLTGMGLFLHHFWRMFSLSLEFQANAFPHHFQNVAWLSLASIATDEKSVDFRSLFPQVYLFFPLANFKLYLSFTANEIYIDSKSMSMLGMENFSLFPFSSPGWSMKMT